MSIETYANTMIYFFLALFLLSVLADVIVILSIIRKKPLKYWRIMVWSTLYALFAMFNTSIAYIAYDDPSDPNFWRYENWNLHDFVVSDIKMLIFWLFLGALIYLISEKANGKKTETESREGK
ncbi:MAG: hypothetical protein HFI48_07445 [Lachnospiraceae bacterium]|nr:hypothetical protein [Lachnospiraceae bacterium]